MIIARSCRVLLLLLAATTVAATHAAEPPRERDRGPDPARQPEPPGPAPREQLRSPGIPPPGEVATFVRKPSADDPGAACYRSARAAAGAGSEDAAFTCDLAVQIARDSGSAAALVAALTNRALVLADGGRLEPALADLEAALNLRPDNAVLHGTRGNLLLRMNRSADALAAHDRAVALAPDDPVSYYNRAFSYRALGDGESAARDVARARELLSRRSSARDASPAR